MPDALHRPARRHFVEPRHSASTSSVNRVRANHASAAPRGAHLRKILPVLARSAISKGRRSTARNAACRSFGEAADLGDLSRCCFHAAGASSVSATSGEDSDRAGCLRRVRHRQFGARGGQRDLTAIRVCRRCLSVSSSGRICAKPRDRIEQYLKPGVSNSPSSAREQACARPAPRALREAPGLRSAALVAPRAPVRSMMPAAYQEVSRDARPLRDGDDVGGQSSHEGRSESSSAAHPWSVVAFTRRCRHEVSANAARIGSA